MTNDQPSVLPEDLNDISAWYELEFDSIDDYLSELKARASEMSHDTYKELLAEIPEGDDVYFWVTTLAKAATDPGDKFRRMQEALYNMGSWPGWDSADRNSDFLEILWAINDVAKALPADPDVISKVLAFVLEDPEIWMFPLAPTAIVAAQHVREQDVRLILGTFVDAWDLSGETPVYKGSSLIDIPDDVIEKAAPLIAVSALNPAAPMDLVDAVLRICTFSENEELKIAFWEYISACITDERSSGGYWDPSAVWQSGFFDNGLAEDSPPMDSVHIMHVLNHFRDNHDVLDLVTPYDEPLAAQVMRLLARRDDVEPQVLEDIAMTSPWVAAVQAAIANPNTPDTAKAAGALRL